MVLTTTFSGKSKLTVVFLLWGSCHHHTHCWVDETYVARFLERAAEQLGDVIWYSHLALLCVQQLSVLLCVQYTTHKLPSLGCEKNEA